MGKLTIFEFTSLNGYFKGPDDDISWNKHAEEEQQFSESQIEKGNILLFGRKTFHMMESYWQSPEAMLNDPGVAKGMNKAEKFVISSTLQSADWQGTTLLKGDLIEEVKKLKRGAKDITILGSGSVVVQLADAGLIDLYQVMIFPLLIPDGTPLLSGITGKIGLKFINSIVLKSGTLVLEYEPVKHKL